MISQMASSENRPYNIEFMKTQLPLSFFACAEDSMKILGDFDMLELSDMN